jgi:hypothetical protein
MPIDLDVVEVMGNMDCVYLYLGLVQWGGLCCPKHANYGVSYYIIWQSHAFGRASLVLWKMIPLFQNPSFDPCYG